MKKIHLFIDTNVFLNFFYYTNDVIDELHKLVALIQNKKVDLYLTDQVCDEFDRNRESKIEKSISDFNKFFIPGLPRLMSHYNGSDNYLDYTKNLKKIHAELVAKTKEDNFSESFPADNLFSELKKVSTPIKSEPDDIQRARLRTEKNSPPGKSDSMGDRLNWELLLAYVPEKVDIHIISKDGDFSSQIEATRPHPVLVKEWKKKNDANLYLYVDLKSFTTKHFPEIKFPTDIEKRETIEKLKSSGSFATTHYAVAILSAFSKNITNDEVKELIGATFENPQISWIGTDPDVSEFFGEILKGRMGLFDKETQELIKKTFGL